MNLYTCYFMGHYLGGLAIVFADSEEEATNLALDQAIESGLAATISIRVELHPMPEVMVYFWDGDY